MKDSQQLLKLLTIDFIEYALVICYFSSKTRGLIKTELRKILL